VSFDQPLRQSVSEALSGPQQKSLRQPLIHLRDAVRRLFAKIAPLLRAILKITAECHHPIYSGEHSAHSARCTVEAPLAPDSPALSS
jgi:hypothetical protein